MTTTSARQTLPTAKPPKPTVSGIVENIVKQLDVAKHNFDRTTYLELLVRVVDNASDRSDALHEEIAKEHHEDNDV